MRFFEPVYAPAYWRPLLIKYFVLDDAIWGGGDWKDELKLHALCSSMFELLAPAFEDQGIWRTFEIILLEEDDFSML